MTGSVKQLTRGIPSLVPVPTNMISDSPNGVTGLLLVDSTGIEKVSQIRTQQLTFELLAFCISKQRQTNLSSEFQFRKHGVSILYSKKFPQTKARGYEIP